MKLLFPPWQNSIIDLFSRSEHKVIIVSPWIKTNAIKLFLETINKNNLKEIILFTRFDLKDLQKGISDMEAFEILLNSKLHTTIFCISNLHAKVYIQDDKSMIISSGNLTNAGLATNVEMGILIEDSKLVQQFLDYFNDLTSNSPELTADILNSFKLELESIKKKIANTKTREISNEFQSLTFGKRIYFIKDKQVGIDLSSPMYKCDPIYEWLVKRIGKMNISKDLLEQMLIHPSIVNEKPDFIGKTYERSSFLGLAVLNLGLASILFRRKQLFHTQGDLYNAVSQLIKPETILDIFNHTFSQDLEFWIPSKQAINEKTLKFQSLKSLVGLLFFSEGFSKTVSFLEIIYDSLIRDIGKFEYYSNPKEDLMIIFQHLHKVLPTYNLVEESGKDHQKSFKVNLLLRDKIIAEGKGGSKKEAETQAAEEALKGKFSEYHKKLINGTLGIGKAKKQFNDNRQTLKVDISLQRKNNLLATLRKFDLEQNCLDEVNLILIHSTWLNDHKLPTYTLPPYYRYIGSLVKSMAINYLIYRNGKIKNEEFATSLANLYSKASGEIFDSLELKNLILLGKTEKISQNLKLEYENTLIGYLFTKKGYDYVYDIIMDNSRSIRESKQDDLVQEDPTSLLQEYVQNKFKQHPEYEIENYEGTDDNPKYTVSVYFSETKLGTGIGKSIKEARKEASLNALNSIRATQTDIR